MQFHYITNLLSMQGGVCMHLNEANEHVGKTVIIEDEFWGSYIGILLGVRETRVGCFAEVKIVENFKEPSQRAIFHKDKLFNRKPYNEGAVKSFNIVDVRSNA